jgi:hypothetical protein
LWNKNLPTKKLERALTFSCGFLLPPHHHNEPIPKSICISVIVKILCRSSIFNFHDFPFLTGVDLISKEVFHTSLALEVENEGPQS